MPKFIVTVAALVPVYSDIEIEASNPDAARAIGDLICRRGWKAPQIEAESFVPETDAMHGFKVFAIEHKPEEQSTADAPAPLTSQPAAA